MTEPIHPTRQRATTATSTSPLGAKLKRMWRTLQVDLRTASDRVKRYLASLDRDDDDRPSAPPDAPAPPPARDVK